MSGANDTESADVTVKIAANVCFTHLKPVTPIQQHPQPNHAQNVLMCRFYVLFVLHIMSLVLWHVKFGSNRKLTKVESTRQNEYRSSGVVIINKEMSPLCIQIVYTF